MVYSPPLLSYVKSGPGNRQFLMNEGKPVSAAKQAYDDFERGHLVGRAVLIPIGSEARTA